MIVSDVQPAAAATVPSAAATVSSARVTVVPTAITRPPRARAALTRAAVVAGTSKRSGYGRSPRSCELTPVCRTSGATPMPAPSRASTRGVNGRPALGISALPGTREKIVWWSASGQSRGWWA